MPRSCVVCLVLAASAMAAYGQEAIFTRSATQPAQGVLSWRQQFRWMRYAGPIDEAGERTILSYGLSGNLALEAQAPAFISDMPGHDTGGFGDIVLLAKTRLWQQHDSAIDTMRLGVFGGAAIAAGPTALSGGGVDPVLGAVLMQVAGRHGWNLALAYQLTTQGAAQPLHPGAGTADLFTTDFAYLFRIAPDEYTEETNAAWYLTLETNFAFETNGDSELLLSPGILYEGSNIAIELGVQAPGYQSLSHRPGRDFGITVGFRLLF